MLFYLKTVLPPNTKIHLTFRAVLRKLYWIYSVWKCRQWFFPTRVVNSAKGRKKIFINMRAHAHIQTHQVIQWPTHLHTSPTLTDSRPCDEIRCEGDAAIAMLNEWCSPFTGWDEGCYRCLQADLEAQSLTRTHTHTQNPTALQPWVRLSLISSQW